MKTFLSFIFVYYYYSFSLSKNLEAKQAVFILLSTIEAFISLIAKQPGTTDAVGPHQTEIGTLIIYIFSLPS